MSSTSFKDNQGRSYDCRFTINDARRVHSACGVYLPDLVNPGSPSMARLSEDSMAFFEMLWSLIERGAKKSGVFRDSFESAMDGDTLEAAFEAIQEAIVLFSPARKRDAVREQLKNLERMAVVGQTAAAKVVDAELTKLESALLPSPESVPTGADSPSGNSPSTPEVEPVTTGDLPAMSPTTQPLLTAETSITLK